MLGKLAVETLDACILGQFLAAWWRGTIAFATKKDGFVAETSNKGRNTYIYIKTGDKNENLTHTHTHRTADATDTEAGGPGRLSTPL